MTKAASHGCHVEPATVQTVPSGSPTRELHMAVIGMGCPSCAMRVRNALVSVDGVLEASVDLVPPVAHIRYGQHRVSRDDLISAIAAAGRDTRHRYRAWVLANPDVAHG